MSDLVKKIEDWAIWCHENCVKSEVQETLYEAADEIERLRGPLGEIVDCINHHYSRRDIETIAREALEKDDE